MGIYIAPVYLLHNEAATGGFKEWPGGPGTLVAAGTIGGATVALEIQSPDPTAPTTSVPVVTNPVLAIPGTAQFSLPANSKVRVTVTGGAPSGLYVYIKQNQENV